ncbi:hypothetical protein FE781_07535 [Paenibacillus thermoaerophilus]|nr:hypothetical protein FE781_07535 [Paenibacillus thermoaerophilus]
MRESLYQEIRGGRNAKVSLATPDVPYIRASSLLRLPIVEERRARRLGHVRDVLLGENRQPKALLVVPGRWRLPAVVLPVDKIRRIGPEAVVAASREDFVRVRSVREYIGTVGGKRRLIGTPVWTQAGESLGTVSDVYFGQLLATPVIGFELTEGWLNDLRDGRRWLPAPACWSVGEIILVPEDGNTDEQ